MLFALLYFSEGAPIGYIWWAAPSKLVKAGMPESDVAWLMSALVLPWTLKFLWAPMVDAVRSARWGLRAWITLAQVLMGLTLLPVAFLDLASEFERAWIVGLLIAHAFCAATQDVAIDALAIHSVPEPERGRVNGWMQVGMLSARALFGGAALLAERWLGQAGVIFALIACVWMSMIVLLVGTKRAAWERSAVNVRAVAARFGRTLLRALRRRAVWLGLLFAAISGVAFEAVGVMSGPMMQAKEFSADDVGWFNLGPRVLGMVVGALVGGFLSDRLGRRTTVGVSLAALAAAVACAGAAMLIEGSLGSAGLVVALSAVYLLIGAFTASSYAMFMDIADPDAAAVEFSAFMGATNLCEMWAAAAMGAMLAAQWSFAWALTILAGVSLIALPILPRLRNGK